MYICTASKVYSLNAYHSLNATCDIEVEHGICRHVKIKVVNESGNEFYIFKSFEKSDMTEVRKGLEFEGATGLKGKKEIEDADQIFQSLGWSSASDGVSWQGGSDDVKITINPEVVIERAVKEMAESEVNMAVMYKDSPRHMYLLRHVL